MVLRGRDSNKCSSLETIAGLPKPTSPTIAGDDRGFDLSQGP